MNRAAKLRKFVVVIAAASAVLMLALSGLSAFEVVRHIDDRGRVQHSDVIVDLLQESRFQVVYAELARQIYLTTGDPAKRDAVRLAAENLRRNAEALQSLTSENPARLSQCEELATMSAEIRSSVETRAHHGIAREGAPAFKRAESLARSMEAEERALQAERELSEQRSADFALIALAGEALFALLLTGATLKLILRDIDERMNLLLALERTVTQMQPRSSEIGPSSS